MKKAACNIIVTIFILSVCIPQKTYASDTDGHWASEIINSSVGLGYIERYSDGSFRPNEPIKRGDFVKLTNRMMGFTGTGNKGFKDISADDSFHTDVLIAANQGYINGYEDGTFRPNESITRETAAVMISGILHLNPNDEYASYFTDSEAMTWSKGAVGAAVKARLLMGYPDGRYMPKKTLTRAEAVSLMSRVSSRRFDTTLDSSQQNYIYSEIQQHDNNSIKEDRIGYQTSGISETSTDDYYRIYVPYYGNEHKRESFTGSVYYSPEYAGGVENISVSEDFQISSNINSQKMEFRNVRIGGRLVVYGVDEIILTDCDINEIEFNNGGSNSKIIATEATAVDEVIAHSSVKLIEESLTGRGFRNLIVDEKCGSNDEIRMSGDFNYIEINGRRTRVIFEKGTAEEIEISDESDNCTLEIKSGARVYNLEIREACYIEGDGTITSADVSVDTATFDLIPEKLTGFGKPIYTSTAQKGSYTDKSKGGSFSVDIRITDQNGKALSGVNVKIGAEAEDYTDSEGRVSFKDIPRGTHDCFISLPKMKSILKTITVSSRDISESFVYDTIVRYGAILRVTNLGTAVEGAAVTLGGITETTNANGEAEFSELLPGVYNYTVDANGKTKTGQITITNLNVVERVETG